MFSNLSRGSILNGVDRENGMRWFTGSVEKIVPSLNTQYSFGQFPNIDVDIVATIDGKQRVFKGIHGGDSIADFGKDTVVLGDTKEALYNYMKSLLKVSEDATNKDTIKWHEEQIPLIREVLSEMMPGASNSSEVRELREQVKTLTSQLSEVLSKLKPENIKTV